MNTDYNKFWGSHLPVLIKIVNMTKGPVLELGMGMYSTPFLHWACYPDRELVSYENSWECYKINKQYNEGKHKVYFIMNWDEAKIETRWEVVLVDHSPSRRRIKDIFRLKDLADYIVVHDTQRSFRFCDYNQIYPLFKYRYDFKSVIPYTTVLSNLKDLKDL
jgi:hypothetical protein